MRRSVTVREGRRNGETERSSIWWRGEVMAVESRSCGSKKVSVRYDAGNGFPSQFQVQYIYPFHTQLINDRDTQLQLRFYECSGDVSYNLPSHSQGDDLQLSLRDSDHSMCRDSDAAKFGERMATFQERLAELVTRLDDIEHGLLSQTAILTRVVGTQTEDQVSTSILGVLRLKTTHMI